VKATRPEDLRPHPGPVPDDVEPSTIVGHKSGALRAATFGVQDGVVSNLALIMAVAGANLQPEAVGVAGVAGLVAGAFSMGSGEYHSMRVQREIYERMIHLEAHELATDPEGEHEELVRILERRGIPKESASTAATAMMSDPQEALAVHVREELGLDPDELGSPIGAAFGSFVAFAIGAFVPVLPYVVGGAFAAFVAAIVLSVIALFGVGAGVSLLTGRGVLFSGTRQVGIGAAAAIVTYVVGTLIGVSVAG
jgi:VIT1/CCC1 family predicted Fe2+/Mn2+ transporter